MEFSNCYPEHTGKLGENPPVYSDAALRVKKKILDVRFPSLPPHKTANFNASNLKEENATPPVTPMIRLWGFPV